MIVSIAVEGVSDAAVLQRVCKSLGLEVGPTFIANGKARLDERLRGYNNAARYSPWLVVRDMDHDAECAPRLIRSLLPDPSPHMYLRIPVRSIESWLLADREGFSRFFGVQIGIVPADPESLDRPKRTIVDLARRSSKRSIRDSVVPLEGTSAEVGREYTPTIIDFAQRMWDPERAASVSPSLGRCLRALGTLQG
jgi:hypothetical protein